VSHGKNDKKVLVCPKRMQRSGKSGERKSKGASGAWFTWKITIKLYVVFNK